VTAKTLRIRYLAIPGRLTSRPAADATPARPLAVALALAIRARRLRCIPYPT
jgi:hypothetical protein